MNILRPDVSVINKFLANFKELFSNKQFTAFSMFVYAMLKDYKRLNLSVLSQELPIDYQSLQYFFSESDWNYKNLNNERIKVFKKQRTTSFTKDGVLAIDDTGSLKPYAKKTEGVGYQYCPSLKSEGYCNVAVVSCFANGSKHIPLNLKFYKPAAEFRLGKYDDGFKSKLDFAKELITEAVEQNIGFSYVVFDSWYASSDMLEFIHNRNLKFITEIKADRRILFYNPLERKARWLQQDELVKLIREKLWHKTSVIRYKDKPLPIYSFQAKLKDCSVPVEAFVIFDKLSDEDSKDARILISNDLKLLPKKVVSTYMQRWGIERAFQELKDSFYFDHYQLRHKEKIMRYWMLCVLVFSLVLWVKLNGCLTKVLSYNPVSLNGHKQALFKLIQFSHYAYLSRSNSFLCQSFAEITSKRFKDKFLYQ